MKKAFTLAEIIVVLVIIGILTAILIPIFSNDVSEKEKVLKFLKGNDNLESAIGELLSSEKYFLKRNSIVRFAIFYIQNVCLSLFRSI